MCYVSKYLNTFLAFLLFFLLFFNEAIAGEVLSWGDCIKEAADNHPDLIAAQQVINQSQASKNITASALFPQVNADLNTSRAKTNTVSLQNKIADSYSYGVTGSQLLFDAGKTINNVRAATENIEASQQSFRFTSSQVRLRLRTAFINLLQAQELVRVTQDIVKIRKSNLELITLNYQSGLAHRGALMTAEANLVQAHFQVSQAKRSVLLAQRELTKEMGRKKFIPMQAKGDFRVIDTGNPKPDLDVLAEKNPSVLQLVAQKNAAEYGLKSTYANFFPSISGQAGAGRVDSHWPPQDNQWNVGLAVSMPVFGGGLRLAQVAQAKALVSQLQENERSTESGIVENLEQTWVALQNAIGLVGVQKKQLLAAQEREKIATAEFSTGFITYDDWTIIEDNMVNAKTNLLNDEASALLAEANWIQAKGGILEYAP
jgi:outer membrane protein TolC